MENQVAHSHQESLEVTPPSPSRDFSMMAKKGHNFTFVLIPVSIVN